jgi:hypothetical protein
MLPFFYFFSMAAMAERGAHVDAPLGVGTRLARAL